ncbi:MAG: HPF/RaiA family ribosome-associated protein, partial [Xanthobacteraceae bacterium]
MQTVPEIDFQGMPGTPRIQAAIEKHISELEQRWGRVTACRVVLKGPGQHHRTGGLYEVHIRLALPNGREVNVERTPPADERHSNLTFAINDAFKHARRQLQDQVRRAQGQVKHHENQPIGTVSGSIRPGSSVSSNQMMAKNPKTRRAAPSRLSICEPLRRKIKVDPPRLHIATLQQLRQISRC